MSERMFGFWYVEGENVWEKRRSCQGKGGKRERGCVCVCVPIHILFRTETRRNIGNMYGAVVREQWPTVE